MGGFFRALLEELRDLAMRHRKRPEERRVEKPSAEVAAEQPRAEAVVQHETHQDVIAMQSGDPASSPDEVDLPMLNEVPQNLGRNVLIPEERPQTVLSRTNAGRKR
jgi:hypothetical protein